MDKLLNSYIRVFKDCLSKEICETTIKDFDNINWHQADWGLAHNDTKIVQPGEHNRFESYDPTSTIDIIMNTMRDCYINYVESTPFIDGFQGFCQNKFIKYGEGSFITEHADHIHGLFDGERKGIPVLSAVGLLNNNFEGGEFVMCGDEEIDLSAGDMLIFPSVFLFPHSVKPIISGVRYSCVTWAW